MKPFQNQHPLAVRCFLANLYLIHLNSNKRYKLVFSANKLFRKDDGGIKIMPCCFLLLLGWSIDPLVTFGGMSSSDDVMESNGFSATV